MHRVLLISLIVFVVMVLKLLSWILKKHINISNDPHILASAGRVALADIILFAIVYAWFGLFSWRNLAAFMVLNVSATILPYSLWRFYKPLAVPEKPAFLNAYLELYFTRRRLSVTLFLSGVLFSYAASIILFLGFAHLHNPDYRSIFAVITRSMIIALLGAAIPCGWVLIQVSVDSSARIRLLLSLYSASIFVFVCALMAGPSRVIPNTKIYLLAQPNHFSVPFNIAVIIAIVLLLFTIPMSIGEVRQAGKAQELSEFEEAMLRKLRDGLRSPGRTNKLPFIDGIMNELCNREQSFRLNLVSPGDIIRALNERFRTESDQATPRQSASAEVAVSLEPANFPGPATLADLEPAPDNNVESHASQYALSDEPPGAMIGFEEVMDEFEEVINEDLTVITDNAGSWNTSDAWDERVTELQNLASHAGTYVDVGSSELIKELGEFRRAKHHFIRSIAYFLGKFLIYLGTIIFLELISLVRQWTVYLAGAKSRDLRWRHFFWLESLIADLTHMKEEIQRLNPNKERRKYIKECVDVLSDQLEYASRMATDVRTQKRFGTRVVVPFVVPLTMAIITPFVHMALGLKP